VGWIRLPLVLWSDLRPRPELSKSLPAQQCVQGVHAHPWIQDLFGHRRKLAPEIDPSPETAVLTLTKLFVGTPLLIFGSLEVHIINLKFAEKYRQIRLL
jgi:hypothetical protein